MVDIRKRKLGKDLKKARLAKGLDIAQLAARARVSTSTISRIENHGEGSLEAFESMAEALGWGIERVHELSKVYRGTHELAQ